MPRFKVKTEHPDATITYVRRQIAAAMRGIRPIASPATAARLPACLRNAGAPVPAPPLDLQWLAHLGPKDGDKRDFP